MPVKVKSLSVNVLAAILSLAACSLSCLSQQPGHKELKTVDGPNGGQFVYGTLTGQSSREAAMIYMLHMVHDHFGDKPQVGKFLQSRDGSSLATFFTLNAKTLNGKPLAGLVIISMPAKGDPQGAVLYDNASNFVSSEPSMMKSLTASWRGTLGSTTASADTRPSGSPEHLFPATGGDRSALINLPKGWKINAVAGGQLIAEGTQGEMVMMGMIYQNIINPQSPGAQQLISGGMASRGPKVVCPLNPDLFSDYVCVFNQIRANNGKSQGSFKFISSQPQAPDGGAIRPIVALFTVDLHDGMGLRNASARLGAMATRGFPSWALTVSTSNIPQQFAPQGQPTLKAVVESYRQDSKVISAESAADMERIRQQGLANQRQTEAINERRDSSAKAYEDHRQQLNRNDAVNDQHNADIDWQSKINQDYILDRSVIRDTGDTVHATLGNNLADALVKSNPNQLEYVPNQQLIRGTDY